MKNLNSYLVLLVFILNTGFYSFGQSKKSLNTDRVSLLKDSYKFKMDTKKNSEKDLITIYSMNFESNESTDGWWQNDGNNDNVTWGYFDQYGYINNGGCAGYTASSVYSAEDFLNSPNIVLEAGKTYEVSFYYAAFNGQSEESLTFSFRGEYTNIDIIETISYFSNSSYIKCTNTISITSTENYYFTWYCWSSANEGTVLIDKFEIQEYGPNPDFSAYPTSGIAPLTVNFTDQSDVNPTAWSWDFNGDGIEDSDLQNPSYTYTVPGNYTVSLTITSGSYTFTETKNNYISVNEEVALSANFSAEPTTGTAPLLVYFTDESTGNPTEWEWDFNNDGTIDSYLQNPSYTYTESGTYSVKLKVTGINGSNIKTEYDYITVTEVGGCLSPINYFMNFDVGNDLSNWMVIDVNNDNSTWGIMNIDDNNRAIGYYYNAYNEANDWLFTPCFDLIQGETYTVSYKYAIEDNTYPENLAFGFGTEISSTMPIIEDLGTVVNENYLTATMEVTPNTTDEYYFGWHCYSEADMFILYVDDFSIEKSIGVNQTIDNDSWGVFPNPAKDFVNIEVSSIVEGPFTIEMYDNSGHKVYESKFSKGHENCKIDISEYGKGIYHLRVISDKSSFIRKLVIE
jgi:PKD repeat protein